MRLAYGEVGTAVNNHVDLETLAQKLIDDVRPELVKFPIGQSRKYFTLLCAAQLAVAAENFDLSPDERLRLRHEIAEQMSGLI